MKSGYLAGLAALVLCAAAGTALAADYREVTVADPGSAPLRVSLWSPAGAPSAPRPLVVISHGNSGGPRNHADLAVALADSGFVVAAPLHTGDNYGDTSAAGFRRDLIDRPRHLARVIAYMLAHRLADPARIGVYGFSLGGLGALILAGGAPSLARLRQRCRDFPASVECDFVRSRHGDDLDPVSDKQHWTHDLRIRAVVVAAPAVTLLFGPGSLRRIRAPVQLWRGAADTNVPDDYNTVQLRRELPAPPEEHVVPLAGHYVFLAPCDAALAAQVPAICTDPPGVDRAAFHRTFNAAVVDFFRARLMAP